MLVMESKDGQTRAEYERELDQALAGSFPASDPPPWTFGVSSPESLPRRDIPTPEAAATDVVIAAGEAYGYRRFASVAEAIGITSLVPLAILLVGVPIALLLRGLAEAVVWLLGLRLR